MFFPVLATVYCYLRVTCAASVVIIYKRIHVTKAQTGCCPVKTVKCMQHQFKKKNEKYSNHILGKLQVFLYV